MPLSRYRFRHAVSVFLEVPRKYAMQCLQGRLQPLEANHGIGVLAVTAFDFTDSDVGAYQELVLSILTPPRLCPGGAWPRSAFVPFVVGTSTAASRLHAIERWHLPHHMSDLGVSFGGEANRIRVEAHDGAGRILSLNASAGAWSPTHQLYQVFAVSGDRLYQADVQMEGLYSEHEEETGRLTVHKHPMCAGLVDADIDSRPFREIWLQNGVQTIAGPELLV